MKTLWGSIDLSAYFGAEVRMLEGEECLFIPLRYNKSIRMIGGRPLALIKIQEHRPDKDGYTHAAIPFLPKSITRSIPSADYVKMTRPLGQFRDFHAKTPTSDPGGGEDNQTQGLRMDVQTLAPRPVHKDEIPI